MLDTLLSLHAIELIVINTDARALLAAHGVVDEERILIRDRSAVLCGDEISMNSVLADDVKHIASDYYVMTHTTNPLLSAHTIQTALAYFQTQLAAQQADSLFTVNRVQTRFYREDGSPINHDPNQLLRTQDLEPWFEENSNLYVFTQDSFAATQSRIGKHPILFESPKIESIDIDNQASWDMALIAADYTACLA